MVACLKSVSAKKLVMASPLITQGSPDKPAVNTVVMSPVVDGDFIPEDPVRLFHNAADIDYLAGVNNMDGHLFTSKDIPSIGKKEDISVSTVCVKTVWPGYRDDVRMLLRTYTKGKGQAGLDAAFAEYTSQWGPNPSQDQMKITAVDIGTDYMFLVPTQMAINLHAAVAKQSPVKIPNMVPKHRTSLFPPRSGRTYSYLLSEPSLLIGPGRPFHSWVGADHADDLQYVFGKPFTTPKAYGDAQKDLSGFLISFWTNFARTGDPNVGKSKVPVTWPRFTSTDQKYLEINSKMDRTYVGQKMRTRFVHFWTDTLPSLPSPAKY
ncbi:Bile salt-activated lipase [Merluccius polli]|uniref:Bile salt-activated lipase n=1 Tax=Merluccius polli TaxID=89951 RepID=A0AA47P5K0_MERPO|nr:Bile salt-activated lipase [Merluccius polli]